MPPPLIPPARAAQVNEVAALKTKNWNSGFQNYMPFAQVDVVGAVYQYEANVEADFVRHSHFGFCHRLVCGVVVLEWCVVLRGRCGI